MIAVRLAKYNFYLAEIIFYRESLWHPCEIRIFCNNDSSYLTRFFCRSNVLPRWAFFESKDTGKRARENGRGFFSSSDRQVCQFFDASNTSSMFQCDFYSLSNSFPFLFYSCSMVVVFSSEPVFSFGTNEVPFLFSDRPTASVFFLLSSTSLRFCSITLVSVGY